MKTAIKVKVTLNTHNRQSYIANISKSALQRLEKMQHTGGILQYHIDVHDDAIVEYYETRQLKSWMKSHNLPT